jgi:hypothetical protein
MFKINQLANNRWNIKVDYNSTTKIPQDVAVKVLWRSYPTAQEAFAAAAAFYFQICDAA